jgi:hypothetical protein
MNVPSSRVTEYYLRYIDFDLTFDFGFRAYTYLDIFLKRHPLNDIDKIN